MRGACVLSPFVTANPEAGLMWFCLLVVLIALSLTLLLGFVYKPSRKSAVDVLWQPMLLALKGWRGGMKQRCRCGRGWRVVIFPGSSIALQRQSKLFDLSRHASPFVGALAMPIS